MEEVLVIAGEKSGEEHFVALSRDLLEVKKDINFFGVGGDEMKQMGVDCLFDIESFSTMGFSEALAKLPYYFKAMSKILFEVDSRKCRFAILIDFQDFNLRLAKKLTERGVKVFYYVAPQAWVWRESRVKSLAKFTHKLFTILPFETKWFKERGVQQTVQCMHPVFSEYLATSKAMDLIPLEQRQEILFLPGSRNSEVRALMPIYIKVFDVLKKRYPELKFSLVISDSLSLKLEKSIIEKFDYIYTNKELDLALSRARVSLAASGTVNLSCAFHLCPTVVCYKSSMLNFFIVRDLIRYNGFASLVNIIGEKEVFPELIQEKCTANNLIKRLEIFLNSPRLMKETINDLMIIKKAFMAGEKKPGKQIGEEIAASS